MILSSTDHLAEFIGSIGRLPPPTVTLFGPGNANLGLISAKGTQCTQWPSRGGLGPKNMFSGFNKVTVGGGRPAMDPTDTAKQHFDLDIAM